MKKEIPISYEKYKTLETKYNSLKRKMELVEREHQREIQTVEHNNTVKLNQYKTA